MWRVGHSEVRCGGQDEDFDNAGRRRGHENGRAAPPGSPDGGAKERQGGSAWVHGAKCTATLDLPFVTAESDPESRPNNREHSTARPRSVDPALRLPCRSLVPAAAGGCRMIEWPVAAAIVEPRWPVAPAPSGRPRPRRPRPVRATRPDASSTVSRFVTGFLRRRTPCGNA
ncbi:hypothetical protein HBB16_04530 [Pseudonocardia sp. MCCB 268]|nr:hypothetical protein [Pseudonocardia cytotoxica]